MWRFISYWGLAGLLLPMVIMAVTQLGLEQNLSESISS